MSYLSTTECRDFMDRDQEFHTSTGDMDSDLFIDILNEVEDVYFDLAITATPTEFLTDQTITVSAAPVTVSDGYTLAVEGGGVFEVDGDGNATDTRLKKTNKGSQLSGYWTERITGEGGFRINFTPLTSITSRSVVLSYVQYRTVLTDGADTLFPSRKSQFIKRALLRLYDIWDENTQLAMNDSLFQSYLKQILETHNPDKSNGVEFDIISF